MKVSVIGTGYVGLVTGICLAEKGHTVYCVDLDAGKIALINQGKSPVHERGLEDLLIKNRAKQFFATTDLKDAVEKTDISIIAVGTPFDGQNINLSFVKEASRQIAEVLKDKESYHTVIVKSTVIPGTTDDIVAPILSRFSEKEIGQGFGLGMNPEFLREGTAVDDFMHPDRFVLGASDAKTLSQMKELYSVFEGVDLICTNNKTAELIKYSANALFAVLISFTNEMANLATDIKGVDIKEVMRGVHSDRRLSPMGPDGKRIRPGMLSYLEAGCGFGGSCFPKDLKALAAFGRLAQQPMVLTEAAIQINASQPLRMLQMLKKHFPDLRAQKIAVLGVSFKPNTDDIRESPAIPLVNHLIQEGSIVKVYDPLAQDNFKRSIHHANVHYCQTLQEAILDVTAVVLVTAWDEFSKLPGLLDEGKAQPLVIDGRRFFDKHAFKYYEGIGCS